MLYLAGQILAFVLVAMLIGAGLAWLFLAAPLRRQARLAAAGSLPTGADGGSGEVAGVAAGTARGAVAEGTSTSHPGAVAIRETGQDAALPADRSGPHVVGSGSTPSPQAPAGSEAPGDTNAQPAAAPGIAREEITALLVRMQEQEQRWSEEKSGLATRLAAAEQQVADSAERLAAGEQQAADSTERLTAAEQQAAVSARRLAAAEQQASVSARRLAAAERQVADSVERLAAGEQQAADSVQRLAAAEQQVTVAQARIDEIESVMQAAVDVDAANAPTVIQAVSPAIAVVPPIPWVEAPAAAVGGAESVAELARETAELREQLGEAETRAAKFSSRLAMVRTEAEEAQRQVATMSTRLDRHQAEWAAERIRLLARIADAEETLAAARVASELAQGPAQEPDDNRHRPQIEAPHVAETWHTGEAQDELSVLAAELPRLADELPESADEAPLLADELPLPVKAEPAAAAADLAPSAADPAATGADDTAESVRDRRQDPFRDLYAGSGAFDAGPLLDAIAGSREDELELIGAALVSAAAPEAMSDQHRPAAEAVAAVAVGAARPVVTPSWGGPAEPVLSSDNLKEIVGVGPVVESRLRVLGITTFRQLAAMGDTDVDRLAAKLDGFGGRIISDDWIGQARTLQARHHSGVA